jgi:tRNA modification GTPase
VVQVVVDDAPQAVDNRQLVVQNKSDLRQNGPGREGALSVSARTGDGLDLLRRAIVAALEEGDGELSRERPEITNVRHLALVERTEAALQRARDAAAAGGGALPEEFVLADLQDARAALEEITGRRAPEDVLTHIFERFCIGK